MDDINVTVDQRSYCNLKISILKQSFYITECFILLYKYMYVISKEFGILSQSINQCINFASYFMLG